MPPAASAEGAQGSGALGELIIHHVSNGPAIATLHLGFMDLAVSKHVIILWVSAAITLALFVWFAGRLRRDPDGLPRGRVAEIVDFFVETIHRQLVVPHIGEEHGTAWTPLIATFFFFILLNNLLGLTPIYDILGWLIPGFEGSSTPTGNFNVTAGLAIVTFSTIILAGSIAHGVVGHWKNMVPAGVPVAVLPLLIVIEFIGMLVRPLALTLRLAANMTAGHIAILAVFSIIFIFKSVLIGVLAVPLVIGLLLLEIIVCFVQAYVFTLLSTVFIGMAVKAHH